jgi:hypothetical protein
MNQVGQVARPLQAEEAQGQQVVYHHIGQANNKHAEASLSL